MIIRFFKYRFFLSPIKNLSSLLTKIVLFQCSCGYRRSVEINFFVLYSFCKHIYPFLFPHQWIVSWTQNFKALVSLMDYVNQILLKVHLEIKHKISFLFKRMVAWRNSNSFKIVCIQNFRWFGHWLCHIIYPQVVL